MSVFVGGCTLEAVEAVCAGDPIDTEDVLDLLAALVARSLVTVDHRRLDTRYFLYETIRQYGQERLAQADDAEMVRARHADHYIAFSARVALEVPGPEELDWGARLAAEADNYQTAMSFALQRGDVERAMALLGDLPPWIRAISELALLDPEPVLALRGAVDHPGSSRALAYAAFRAYGADDYRRAVQLVARSEEAEHRLGPGPDSVDVDGLRKEVLASVAGNTGDLHLAADLCLQGAEAARASGRLSMAAWLLTTGAQWLSWVDPDRAAEAARDGLALARQSGSPYAISHSRWALALALADSNPDQARRLLAEATCFDFENTLLITACTAAGRVGEWSVLLHAAALLLSYEQRTGFAGDLNLSGILNLVARGLAPSEPQTAAQIQGAVTGLAHRLSVEQPTPPPGGRRCYIPTIDRHPCWRPSRGRILLGTAPGHHPTSCREHRRTPHARTACPRRGNGP
jgi:hypothetical protein